MKSIKKKEMFAVLLVSVIAISMVAVFSSETRANPETGAGTAVGSVITSGNMDGLATYISKGVIYVPDDYAKIQWAVDNATAGDTIIVRSGTYYENVNVTRQLILRGVDTGGGKPVVDAGGNGSAITLSADGITLLGFTATNSSKGAGIKVTSNNNTITDNTACNNKYVSGVGIILDHSSNNTITDNNASNNEYGIRLKSSFNNTIANNTASNNHYYGIYPYFSSGNIITNNNASNNKCGIYLVSSSNNIITNNTANNSAKDGIYLYASHSNIITGNTASNNEKGIYLCQASVSNKIYLNNFVNNNRNVYSTYNAINIWNSTKPITYQYNGSSFTDYMGNYWGDYTGSDVDGDGIGDTPYSVDSDEDGSPLMEPVEEYFKPIEDVPVCYGPVCVLSADSFNSSGDLIDGWYWLKDAEYGQYGKWTFSDLPTNTSDEFIYIRFDALVTNKASGGSGYNTDVKVYYDQHNPDNFAEVLLANLHPEFQEPIHTKGWGYSAIGWIEVPLEIIPESGELSIELKRLSPHTEHVAVNKECCTIEWH